MQTIPLAALPSQTISINLNNQVCRIKVYQKVSGLYLDLYLNDILIIGGVICENLNRIVRSIYLGFSGDLIFFDTRGAADPDYLGFGTDPRYTLNYLTPSDLAAAHFLYGN